jgi:lipopolysaccharide assembly protein A
MQVFTWIFRALLFVLLVVLALHNTHEVVVRLYFGVEWRAPMVLVVLSSFAIGALLGILALLPRLWRKSQAHPAQLAKREGMVVPAPAEPAAAPKSLGSS